MSDESYTTFQCNGRQTVILKSCIKMFHFFSSGLLGEYTHTFVRSATCIKPLKNPLIDDDTPHLLA
jgi:hypothetical protein